jgi:hypothetical protein
VLDLDVRRQDEDGGLRDLLTDHARGVQSFHRMRRRHPDVDDRQVGLLRSYELDQPCGGLALADDLESEALEQARETFTEQDVVVRQHDAHCSRATRMRRVRCHGTIIQPGCDSEAALPVSR